MKLKFVAEKKDIKIFIGFCIGLLYFCCIGVLNAFSLATRGQLYGIIPFEALFNLKYLPTTLFLFFVVLLGVLFSVGSYFFERDEGVGFSTQKSEKGYSRWCKDKEMKATLCEVDPKEDNLEHAGIPIITE